MLKEIIWIFVVVELSCCYGLPSTKLKQGIIQGTLKKSYGGKLFSAFEGIPYAKPPIGNLRFQEPVPAPGWNDILVANKSYVCSQLGGDRVITGSEDCLYLYVYVPKEQIDKTASLDVVVHIHGGPWIGLISGSPEDMALPDYVMDQNIILVTLNYRLGAQGFLSTGDGTVSANNGFKDQVLALKWIRDNIREFGGNPNSVTITGFSAGGAGVQFHYISPLSKGLFHRGYSSSYQVTNPGSLALNPLEKTKQLAEILKCPVDSSNNMINCLRNVPINKLVNTTIWFKPSVEKGVQNAFLPDVPYRLLKDKKVQDVPWVASNVIDEDIYALNSVYKNRKEIFSICRDWTAWGVSWLDLGDYLDKDKQEETLDKIKKFYLNDCNLTEANGLEKLNKLMTDRHFFVGTELSLRTQPAATKSPVYFYLSKFVPEEQLQLSGPHAASHSVDAKLLFKFRTNPDKLKPKTEKMMRLFTDFLAEYAKTGIPKIGNVKWTPVNPQQNTLNILELNSPDNIKMINVPELAPLKFWDSLPIKENNHLK
ncbi:hypothetical protein HHI36_001933 [Cryptolaemus montrouzieri]|uniref:Carboxylic ester hydrolase n=1 Tax=Cryptolaemus montrouzieri TaxID=559131 RepID=A0ABD2P9P5_9CUCU